MIKSLILVRHAKSSWDFPLDDKKRPLTESGVLAIEKIGKLAQEFIDTDFQIWSSTATRATQTALIFCEKAGLASNRIIFRDDLYTFSETQIEKTIKNCKNDVNKLILFGHNEAITDFVNKFGDINVDNVPTAGLVYLQFDVDCWENINKGKIIKHIFPKELD